MAILNEEQEMLRDMARGWATNENPVAAFRKVRSEKPAEGYSPDVWRTMGEMGWAGIVIPEEHGGSNFGWMSAGLVVEELGKTLTASPLVATTTAASAIMLGGSEEQKAKWLPRLASGEIVGTLAVDEGPRFTGKCAARSRTESSPAPRPSCTRRTALRCLWSRRPTGSTSSRRAMASRFPTAG
jgi:alkylation response protein AidB-like acyl-CoA dehydrogenase